MTEMDRVSPYMLWRSPFFEVAWAPGSPFLRTPIRPEGPIPGWVGRDAGPWSTWAPLAPAEPLPRQGWKIHVSALPRDAAAVVGAAARICREQGVAHKMLRTRELVLASQLKYADPVQSGKVFTCYPAAGRLEALALRLADELPCLPHPPVQGEPHLAGSPVSLRHGAFQAEWLLDTAGTPRPGVRVDGAVVEDRRGIEQHSAPGLPAALMARVEATSPEDEHLEISQVRLLHRSNAGGVYSAQWHGRRVVLKEARDHCGLDLEEQPAGIRLRHEWKALRRLAGTGVAPEPLDHLRVGSSEFLVMGLVPGASLATVLKTRHPSAVPNADRTGYLEWLDGVSGRLDELVATMNRMGIVHGDLHPGNLMDGPDGLVAIDFESCTIDGAGPSAGLHHPQFSRARDAPDDHADESARRRIMAVLEVPALISADQSGPVQAEMLRVGSQELRGDGAPLPTSTRTEPLRVEELVEGIKAFADPSRPERLFPGDPVQFQRPGAGLGLLHGSAGVLLSLHLLGETVDQPLLDILCEQIRALQVLPRGVADGAEGMAWALLRMGRPDEAEQLLERCIARGLPDADCPWWANGTAGIAAVLDKAGAALERADFTRMAGQQRRLTCEALESGMPGRAGLLHGWAGVGLALLPLRSDGPSVGQAAAALRLERGRLSMDGRVLTAVSGSRRMPYLGRGGLAAALLARMLPPGSFGDDDAVLSLIAAAGASCRSPHVLEAGLIRGRAGLLMALRALAPGDRVSAEHARRLRWGCTRVTDGSGAPRTVVLGRAGARAGLDLASGSAGVALALAPDPWAVVSDALALA